MLNKIGAKKLMTVKEKKLVFQMLFRTIKNYKKNVLYIFFLAIVSFGINLISPRIESKIVDSGILSKDIKLLVSLVLIVILLKFISEFIFFIQSYLKTFISIDVREKMSIDAFEHILKLKVKHIKKSGLYKIVKDVEYDLTMITQIFSDQCIECVFELAKIIGYFIGLLLIDWRMTCFIVILVPFKCVQNKIINKIREKSYDKLLEIQKQISEWQSDIFDGIYEIKLWNLYDKQKNIYSTLLKKSNQVVKRISILDGVDLLLNNIYENSIFNLLYIIAGVLIWKNQLTLGEMIAFISFSQYLFQPIAILMDLNAIIAEITPALKSFLKFNDMEEENFEGKRTVNEINSIEFRDVYFSYDKQSVFKGLNFTLKKGERTVLMGKNGAGKSSIFSLLLRYYEPDSGQILVNGIDISDIPIDKYRELFSCISQEVFLFNDTIKNNVFINNNDQQFEMQNKLLRFKDKFREKENKIVGKNGIYLSGGERQRIAFARCLNKKSEILLADEVTSNCDNDSKKLIEKILNESKFKIVLLITHDKQMCSLFEKIILLDEGEIIYQGNNENI